MLNNHRSEKGILWLVKVTLKSNINYNTYYSIRSNKMMRNHEEKKSTELDSGYEKQ